MKIGLFGIYGVYNFGCEAIVRGARHFIGDVYPEAEVIYFSYNYEYDSKMLQDIDVKVVPIIEKKTLVKRIINKLLTITSQKRRILCFDYKAIIKNIDLLFSIGGDIYTIPQYLREKKRYPYYNSLVDFCDYVINSGKDVIVYGASVGPFGNNKKALKYYIDALSKYKAIICREQETIEYLNKLGLNNMYFFPDPAYQVKGKKESLTKNKYIGVNLSPLSVQEIYGKCDSNVIEKMAKIMDRLYEKFQCDLLFVPHVISKAENDNDALFLENIKNKMDNYEHVIMADTNNGFLGIKNQLQECKLVISARMHCAVNAVVENIPTIFLCYSQKSIGMSSYVYKNSKWLLDIKNIDESLIKMVEEMLIQKNELNEILSIRNEEIDDYYKENIECMKKKFRY